MVQQLESTRPGKRLIAVVADSDEERRRSATLLNRRVFDAEAYRNLGGLAELKSGRRPDLVLLQLPRDRWHELDFLPVIPAGYRNKKVPTVLWLEEAVEEEDMVHLHDKGITALVPPDAQPEEINNLLSELLRVRLRSGMRVLFRLTMEGHFRALTCVCNSVDVSASGVLLSAPIRFPVKSQLLLRVLGIKRLADSVYRAEVVRQDHRGERKDHHRYGLRFFFDDPAGKEAWLEFVSTLA